MKADLVGLSAWRRGQGFGSGGGVACGIVVIIRQPAAAFGTLPGQARPPSLQQWVVRPNLLDEAMLHALGGATFAVELSPPGGTNDCAPLCSPRRSWGRCCGRCNACSTTQPVHPLTTTGVRGMRSRLRWTSVTTWSASFGQTSKAAKRVFRVSLFGAHDKEGALVW